MPDYVFVDPLMKVVAILLVESLPKTNFEFNCKEELVQILTIVVLPHFEVLANF